MYIYYALINALSTHVIHINLNMIFYTHVEHSPTKTIYIKYYTEKQTHTRTHTHARIYIIAVTRRTGRADPTPELGCVTEQIADLTTLDQQF